MGEKASPRNTVYASSSSLVEKSFSDVFRNVSLKGAPHEEQKTRIWKGGKRRPGKLDWRCFLPKYWIFSYFSLRHMFYKNLTATREGQHRLPALF